jgi:hypothetical protein
MNLKEKYIYLFIAVLGAASSFYFRTNLQTLPYQFGIDAIGLFIPPFLTGIYMVFGGVEKGFTQRLLFGSILLFAIQLVPFWDLLVRVVLPNPGEDFARNLYYAKNMIANHTLWGGDKIIYTDEGNAYITQPGYRYFIALELLVFKEVYRFVSILNILLFIITLFFFLKVVAGTIENLKFRKLLLFFLVLTIPYATKNILMGLSEWLMVSILMLSVYFFKMQKSAALSIILLAFVCFMRQNTLPAVLLLAAWIIIANKNKILLFLLFLLVLLLPVYHNLYFAGESRFFVSIYHWPFLSYELPSKYVAPSGFNYMHVLSNLLHYLGIHIRGNGSVDFLEESFIFLLAFIIIYHRIQKVYFFGYQWLFYMLVTLSIILPTIFFATDFYPRFEFVCVYFTLAAFLYLHQDKKNARQY